MGDTKAAENFFTTWAEPDGILHIYIARKPKKLPKTGRSGWWYEHWDFYAPMKKPPLSRVNFYRKPEKYDPFFTRTNNKFHLTSVQKNVIQS